MTLTVKQIEAAHFGAAKERLSDGGGLYVRLYPSGRKAFQVQVPKEAGTSARVWVSPGHYPDVSLKEARETATSCAFGHARAGRPHRSAQALGPTRSTGLTLRPQWKTRP